MKSKIESLGVYLPDKVVTTSDLMNRCRRKPRWDLEKLTGIKERRVGENETSFDIAYKACWNALKMSRYQPDNIDMIVVTSISRLNERTDELYLEPSLSTLLKSKLGARNAVTFDIVNACAGMMTGMYIMDSYIRSGAVRTGIVVSGERITPLAETAVHEIRNSFDGQLASLTVGDCGAAVIMDASTDGLTGFHYIDMHTASKYSKLCIASPSKRGKGFAMITKPIQIQKYAFSIKDPLFKETIDIVGWSVEDCDWFIPHQTAERAMKKAQRLYEAYLGVPFKRPLSSVVGLYGNTSSTSHMLCLHDKILNDGIDADDKLIFIIGASGLVAGYAAYTIDDLPARYRAQFEKKGEQKYA